MAGMGGREENKEDGGRMKEGEKSDGKDEKGREERGDRRGTYEKGKGK